MNKEAIMNLIAQLAFLNIPTSEYGQKLEITKVQDIAVHYINHPEELQQQGKLNMIPCT